MSPRQHQAIGAALSRLDILAKYTAPSAMVYGRSDEFGHIVTIHKRQLITEAAQSLRDVMHEEANRFIQAEADAQNAWQNAKRLALELECLLMDTKDLPTVSKWWASAHEALELHQAALREDLSKCPQCGGPADNGHDRELPPNPYHCTRCTDSEGGEV